MVDKKLLSAYFRQQYQLSMPDFVLENSVSADELKTFFQESPIGVKTSVAAKPFGQNLPKTQGSVAASFRKEKKPVSISSRLSGLKPIDELLPGYKSTPKKPKEPVVVSASPEMSYEQKRMALKELYVAGCTKCHLAQTRTKFVFGSGNADAKIMVIGEAPGEDEDLQGLPFVGRAGQLLTDMLKSIKLDRKNDVFIANVLKCRPPGNRNPESQEIVTCIPLLKKQIEIIRPKAILLLGRIAAHAVLDISDSIAAMRSKVHDYNGIPAMVIYHPAALLRNVSYKRPAWEDLQKFQTLVNDLGIYGTSK